MFGWLFGRKKENIVDEKMQDAFSAVKKDMDFVGRWIKHLNTQDKQLFDMLNELKLDLSSIKDELVGVREGLDLMQNEQKSKQLFKKSAVLDKQTAVEVVEEAVQTAVQTANFYDILKNLSSNEKMLIMTLLNSDLKLSYEDLALLLGKEKSTVRGQINSIKQKNEGLIEEISEKNGKKRVYIPEEMKEKLHKYAKVRVSKGKKSSVKTQNSENTENND